MLKRIHIQTHGNLIVWEGKSKNPTYTRPEKKREVGENADKREDSADKNKGQCLNFFVKEVFGFDFVVFLFDQSVDFLDNVKEDDQFVEWDLVA